MATKRLSRTAIEGGRSGYNKHERRQSYSDERARVRDELRKLVVDADLQTGRKKGIRGSPAIVINGRRIDGVPTTQALADYIESALSTPPQTDQRRKQ